MAILTLAAMAAVAAVAVQNQAGIARCLKFLFGNLRTAQKVCLQPQWQNQITPSAFSSRAASAPGQCGAAPDR